MDLFEIVNAAIVAASIPGAFYQRHRRRTPYYITTDQSKGKVWIVINRRGFVPWPEKISKLDATYDKDTYHYNRHVSPCYSVKFKGVDPHEDDADEQIIDAIIEAKAKIKEWNDMRQRTKNFAKNANKALKR